MELRKHVEWVVPELTYDQWIALSELFEDEGIFRIEDVHYVQLEVLCGILKRGLAHRLTLHSAALDKIRRKEAIKKISKERAKVRHAKRSAESDLFDQRTIRIETSTSTLTEVVASDVENEMTEGSRVNKPTNADGKKNMEAASRVTQTKAANVELNWTDGFVVKIPAVTSGMLKMGPLAPCARNALVRDIMDQVMERERNPRACHLAIVAKRLVSAYPNLMDKCDNTKLGTGYGGLLKYMINRYSNVNRRMPDRKRRKIGPKASMACRRRKKLKTKDQYGCKNWQPATLPEGETKETQESKRIELKMLVTNKGDEARIAELHVITYFTQRLDINEEMTACELQERWPNLFTIEGALAHALELTGEHFLNNIDAAYASKGQSMLTFLKARGKEGTQNIISDMEKVIEQTGSTEAIYAGLFCAMNKYLKEKTTELLIQTEESGSYDELELPETPCIVYLGDSPVSATRFMVAADGWLVNNDMTKFTSALAMMFACQFNLNTKYAPDASATMDLFQRVFVGINPEKGTKSSHPRDSGGIQGKVATFFDEYQRYMTFEKGEYDDTYMTSSVFNA